MIYFKNTGRYSHILFLLSLYVVFLGLVHCPSTLCSEGGITGVTWVVESVGKVSCFNMVSAVGPRCMRKQGAQGAIKSLISRVSTYILKKLFRVQTYDEKQYDLYSLFVMILKNKIQQTFPPYISHSDLRTYSTSSTDLPPLFGLCTLDRCNCRVLLDGHSFPQRSQLYENELGKCLASTWFLTFARA